MAVAYLYIPDCLQPVQWSHPMGYPAGRISLHEVGVPC